MISFRRKKTQATRIGFCCADEAFALAAVDLRPAGRPVIKALESCTTGGPSDGLSRMQQTVRDFPHGLGLAVAPLGQYQLLQLEPPNVPEAEMLQAVRWQIRDLIDLPVEQAVIDLLPLPDFPHQKKYIYVAVADPRVFGPLQRFADSLTLSFSHIDIVELALRNLLIRSPASEQGIACLYLGRTQGLFLVVKQGLIWFSRPIHIGTDDVLLPAQDQTNHASDSLIVDLQRSLDYYESSIGKHAVRTLSLCPLEVELPELRAQMDSMLAPDVVPMNLYDLFECEVDVSDAQFSRCLLPLGAALKTEGLP